MQLQGVELRTIAMPLRTPFRTSFGAQQHRDIVLVRVTTSDAEGWGECVAPAEPRYSAEYAGGAADVLRRHLVPTILGLHDVRAHAIAPSLAAFSGHRMAKAALEMAVLDAELRQHSISLAHYLGAVRDQVPVGVSVGIEDSIPELLDTISGFLDQGYVRVKMKIEPGWDLEPVRAVRERFGEDLSLQVDANGAYTLADARHLEHLDEFDLLLIEQPLAEDDLRGHATLARRLHSPICLDESIGSARQAADAIALGACSIVNIKPGRVGGYLEARRIHDLCQANGIAVWCGGMLETGLGRAANLGLAALPGFVLPGDISASDRYYETDITAPFVLDDGHIAVPTRSGIGVSPHIDLLDEVTTSSEWIT